MDVEEVKSGGGLANLSTASRIDDNRDFGAVARHSHASTQVNTLHARRQARPDYHRLDSMPSQMCGQSQNL
jgi:hypothetical protein